MARSYNIELFNKNILELIEKNFTPNFETNLMEHTLPYYDNQLAYYKSLISAFQRNLTKILKSDGAKNFFKHVYNSKYPDLVYHFDRDEIIHDIFRKIIFLPIYNEKDNGFTNPVDMSIVINSIPGRIGNPKTYCLNRKFLNLGMLLIIALLQIFGHYMRRYYSMITGRTINFDTSKNNSDKLTGSESGYFIEKNFIGILPGIPSLGLNKCFALLYTPHYANYPIIPKNNFSINIDILKTIYNDNKDSFDFIDNENEDEDKDNKLNKLTNLDDYLYTIIDINDVENLYKHCRYEELYFIYLDRIIDY